ncbi:MAG: hypothetical protein HYU39_05940 [Thaumarchaeota archaeon]|nr:hypothetical protein [Nitrososphaerota archaeon]
MKAKVGQLLYNLYLTDRLKAEVLEKLYSKNQISLRIDLGKDRDGKDIIMDILISRITPQVKAMKEDEGVPEPAQSDKASEGSVQPTS